MRWKSRLQAMSMVSSFHQGDADANQKQGKSAKSTRKINLDEIDEDDELVEMEESERIAVEMMKANGNTVDYTA